MGKNKKTNIEDRYKKQYEKQHGCCANCLLWKKEKELKFDPQGLWLICDICFIIWYRKVKNDKDKTNEN